MKIKHTPAEVIAELEFMDDPVRSIVKNSIKKSDDWRDARKSVKRSLELVIYQAKYTIDLVDSFGKVE